MDATPFLDRILDDEGLTADLDESDAMALLKAVADRVRVVASTSNDASHAHRLVEELCKRARETARAMANARKSDDHRPPSAFFGRLVG